ncbi:cyclase family protein [Costertonia aggregata]|uniref:Cyclase family protein n=1 Tax=Costertonia aggregata TaxID=343403 RepID=A0A7H9AMI6_9FLAO|nr:cyclase family protein [Costertonia aggregata]QLG44661.1 cyclase family protein [Costertonia aggregata]
MKSILTHNQKEYRIDLSKPLDISIPLHGNATNVNAWYLGHPKIEPHKNDNFIGSVTQGASTNFNDIWFNPHAHGTHTECVGHITKDFYSVNQSLNQFYYLAEVVTVAPEKNKDDLVISRQLLQNTLKDKKSKALVVRTLPNTVAKKSRQYSNTNPPYLTKEAAEYLKEIGVEHLLVDLPSIDKEKDDGALLAHKAFWDFEGEIRENATITEFVYVDNDIPDGTYLLNLQVAPFENDASPSRPVLYKTLQP